MTSNSDETSGKGSTEYSPNDRKVARQLLRARTRLIVCLWTLPVYVVAVWLLLNNQRDIETIMYIYMALWAGFAVDMARRLCPKCHKQFFVKNILMTLRSRRCVHCEFDAEQAQEGQSGSGKDQDKDEDKDETVTF